MRIHRTARSRFFTTLGNEVLRDNRLSFCARGILGHLLSLPDGQRGDIRTLAERTPEGRERVASALRELERFGYLKRAVKRTPEGRLYTEVDVFDTLDHPTSRVTPNAGLPGSGSTDAGPGGDQPLNEQDEESTLPEASTADGSGREGDVDDETTASTTLLARVARTEPQLALGHSEALRLAPLVAEWRRRGATDLHVIGALTAGLPNGGVHHPARFLETRLCNKMPAELVSVPARPECEVCRAPVIAAGLCHTCRAVDSVAARTSSEFTQIRKRGAALARAALRGLSIDGAFPAAA
jgi:Helix-turn-helix domain